MSIGAASYQPIAGDSREPVSKASLDWPLTLDVRPTEPGHHHGEVEQAHLVCDRCGQSVFCLSTDLAHRAYVFTPIQLLSGVLRHVREVHCDGSGVLLDK